MRSSEDFPEPDGPTMVVTRAAGNSLSTSRSACTSSSATT